jgi:hypothetical protein
MLFSGLLFTSKIPDHDDDEEKEEDFIFSHVQLAGLLSGTAEEDQAEGLNKLEEEEGQAEDEIDQIVRTDDLSNLLAKEIQK